MAVEKVGKGMCAVDKEKVGPHCLETSKQQIMLCVYICDKRTLKDNFVYISDWGG